MKTLSIWIVIAFATSLNAQQVINYGQVKASLPNSGTPGRIDFFESMNVYRVHVEAASTANLTSNLVFRFPYLSDTAGDCLVSAGLGQWNPGGCGGTSLGTSPIVISGGAVSCPTCVVTTGGQTIANSTSGTTLTITQSGAGNALTVTGGITTDTLSASGGVSGVQVSATNNMRVGGHTFVDTTGYRVIGGTTIIVDTSQNAFLNDVSMSGNFSGTHAQNVGTADIPTFFNLSMKPQSSVTPVIDFYESGGVFKVHVQAASTFNLVSNITFKLPYTADTAGQCLVSLGSGQWNPGSCSAGGGVASVTGTSPIVSSGGTTPAISCPTCVTTAGGQSISGTTTFNIATAALWAGTSISLSGGASFGSMTVTTSGISVAGASTFSTGLALTGGSFVQSGGGGIYSGSLGFVYNGSFAGVTSTTCSQFRGGICTAP